MLARRLAHQQRTPRQHRLLGLKIANPPSHPAVQVSLVVHCPCDSTINRFYSASLHCHLSTCRTSLLLNSTFRPLKGFHCSCPAPLHRAGKSLSLPKPVLFHHTNALTSTPITLPLSILNSIQLTRLHTRPSSSPIFSSLGRSWAAQRVPFSHLGYVFDPDTPSLPSCVSSTCTVQIFIQSDPKPLLPVNRRCCNY